MHLTQIRHIIREEVIKLTERTADSNNYGCLMIKVPIKNWDTLRTAIKNEDIYTTPDGYGFETEPHVTILYGFHDNVSPAEIKDAIYNWVKKPLRFTLSKIGSFQTPIYDVLKFDVDSPDLVKLHELFKRFPHESTYPEYHPHATISYLKNGTSARYLRELRDPIEVSSNAFIFSTNAGKKYEWVNDKRLTNDSDRFTKVGPMSL